MEKTTGCLNSKIWYRFIKVICIVCFLIVLVIALFISYYAYKPRKVFDNEKSYIQCNNGMIYNLKQNEVHLFSDYIDSYDDQKFRKWCSDGNYKLISRYKIEGSWGSVSLTMLLTIIGLTTIFEIIRRIFYYIVLGAIFPSK